MTDATRIDPEVREALAAFFAAAGPGGLRGGGDLAARRRRHAALMRAAAAGGAGGGAGGGSVCGGDHVARTDRVIAGPSGGDLRVRIYRRRGDDDGSGRAGAAASDHDRAAGGDGEAGGHGPPRPALLFLHGGGMVMGDLESGDRGAAQLAAALGAVVVAVDYRLAPEHPYPAGVEDCYAALGWLSREAAALGADTGRIGLYGTSGGGGLAAATALLCRDRGGPRPCFQLLAAPMLDDRNASASSHEITDVGIWDRADNVEAWQAVLGDRAGGASVPASAAPARAEDLAGLPPACIDVGELDVFRDESIDYAARLLRAGVSTELRVHAAAVHGTETFAPHASISARIVACRIDALRRALWGRSTPPVPVDKEVAR